MLTFAATAQSNTSYGEMQTRFEKKKLAPADSAAFIQSGIQKAQTLFEYGDVHVQNTMNRANQMYVEQKTPELFYTSESDTLDMTLVMSKVQTIVQNQSGESVTLIYSEKLGFLGQVTSVDTEPIFHADLILLKVKKSFGKTSKKVWQVFLTNPEFKD